MEAVSSASAGLSSGRGAGCAGRPRCVLRAASQPEALHGSAGAGVGALFVNVPLVLAPGCSRLSPTPRHPLRLPLLPPVSAAKAESADTQPPGQRPWCAFRETPAGLHADSYLFCLKEGRAFCPPCLSLKRHPVCSQRRKNSLGCWCFPQKECQGHLSARLSTHAAGDCCCPVSYEIFWGRRLGNSRPPDGTEVNLFHLMDSVPRKLMEVFLWS